MNVKMALAVGAAAIAFSGCAADEEPVGTPVDTGTGTDDDGSVDVQYEEPQTLLNALTEFGACMNMEVFVGTGVYRLYDAGTIDGNGQNGQRCMACHQNCEGGACITDDVVNMFEGNSSFPGVMRLVTGTVDERGNFDSLVPSNRYIDKGIAPCLAEIENPELENDCHPNFELNAEMESAVLTFVEESLERWKNGDCDAPYLVQE